MSESWPGGRAFQLKEAHVWWQGPLGYLGDKEGRQETKASYTKEAP